MSDEQYAFEDAKRMIMSTFKRCIGEFGTADANPYFIRNQYMQDKQKGVLRVYNKKLADSLRCLAQPAFYQGKEIHINVKGISGILKKARYKFLEV